LICGEGGIRTRDTLSSIHTFQACSFSHSDTSPKFLYCLNDQPCLLETFIVDNPEKKPTKKWKIKENTLLPVTF
jgi:hypothetical protein